LQHKVSCVAASTHALRPATTTPQVFTSLAVEQIIVESTECAQLAAGVVDGRINSKSSLVLQQWRRVD